MVFVEKADVIVEYDEEIRSPSFAMQVPAVIRVRAAMRNMKRGVKFSRVNVYTRDGFKCQYCGERFEQRYLSYDHVIPRASGGRTDWTNIVTACKPCNNRKGSRTCDEAGMWPLNRPVRPKTLPLTGPIVDVDRAPPEWHDFLPSVA
jgi:5-methylcytosine-specific restriction endonuclease McrA